MMVLLPLIYVGLIGLIACGVWVHAVNDTSLLTGTRGSRGGKVAALAYFTPIVAGATAILFMIKPLFAPRPKEGRRYSLDPAMQPRLFQFVERLCRIVRAPVPGRIDLDTQVNASASFRRRPREHAGQRHGADDWIAAGFGNDAPPAHRSAGA